MTLIRTPSADAIFIAVFGITGAGKSTFISTCTQEPVNPNCHGLLSCTTKVTIHTMTHNGRIVHLIDTPGFNDTVRTDGETLQELAYWLAAAHEREYHLSGVIYLHSITDTRLQGSSLRSLEAFKKMIGETNYDAVVLATTRWDELRAEEVQVAVRRQRELREGVWNDIIENGGMSVSLSAGRLDAMRIISHFVERSLNKRLKFAFQRQFVEEGLELCETDAGKVFFQKLDEDYKQLEERLEKNESEIRRISQKSWETNKEEVQGQKQRTLEYMKPLRSDMDRMRKNMKKVRDEWEKKLQYDARVLNERLKANEGILNEKLEELSRFYSHSRSSHSRLTLSPNPSGWLDISSSNPMSSRRPDQSVLRRAKSSTPMISPTYISSPCQPGSLAPESIASEESLVNEIEELGGQNDSIEKWKSSRLDNYFENNDNKRGRSSGWTVLGTSIAVGQLIAAMACTVM